MVERNLTSGSGTLAIFATLERNGGGAAPAGLAAGGGGLVRRLMAGNALQSP